MRWTRKRRLGAGAAVVALVLGVWFWRCLPEPLFSEPMSSVLLARDGTLLGATIAADQQWRFPLRERVAEKFAAALVTYEDKRFWHHPGVDPLALARAARMNLGGGAVRSGGSTITMQVIRLARRNPRRTYGEKLVEMLWALRLELRHGKAEILALYAAHAPFGGNVVGVEAAAWRYFGRGPEDLSWAEAATLAVLPNSPALVHPARRRDVLREKRDGLLRKLHAAGRMDDLEFRTSLLEPLPDEPRPLPQHALHLLETLTARDTTGDTRFESTLRAQLQRSVEAIVARYAETLQSLGIANAAVLVVDNRSWEVVTYVGNSAWDAEGAGHAMDLIPRPRSTGSVLKPLLFARMLDAGELTPLSLVPDLPTHYAGYMPENADRAYRGAVPARHALARSLNVPAVRMLQDHGVDRFYDFLKNAGMTTLTRPPGDYGLTLVLGGAEGTLWDLTGVYANLAAIARGTPRGRPAVYRVPRLLAGDTTWTARPAELSTGAAWLTLEALVEVVRPGVEVNWTRFSSSQPIAWKTGTSFGHRDAWAIGSTARYTVGVWVGNATGEGRPELTGVGAAAPLLFDVFDRLDASPWFDRPDYALKPVTVCRDDGYLATAGCATAKAWIPRDAHFERPSAHHRVVHLDPTGRWRVDARCEAVRDMAHATWFVLPAGQEYYYRRNHADYRPLPPFRPDCAAARAGGDPLEFLYPAGETRLYIPVDLDGRKGRVVFRVAHRDPGATLYWHLDDTYLGTTATYHERAVDVGPGRHVMTVVDQDGNRVRRAFEVLARGGER
jgi:penicillin-binding protein 1C